MHTDGLGTSPFQPARGFGHGCGRHYATGRSGSRLPPSLGLSRTFPAHIGIVGAAVLELLLRAPVNATAYGIACSALACAALLVRNSFPVTAVLVTMPGLALGWAHLAAVLALGFLAYHQRAGRTTWACATLFALSSIPGWLSIETFSTTWREQLLAFVHLLLLAMFALTIGVLSSTRKDLRERFDRLRPRSGHGESPSADTRAFRDSERALLAREMHDVVAHDITLITMQANALESGATDGAARDTAAVIRQLSSRTLDELRSIIGMLRTAPPGRDQRHEVDQLEELADTAGVAADFQIPSLPGSIPPELATAIYRTVQEALINVRKHAPGAQASVRVGAQEGVLWVEVRNSAGTSQPDTLPRSGHGLAGLAEHALLLGGTLHTGSTDDGGFRVTARYPWQSSR